MVASLSRAVIDEARARAIIVQFVILVTICVVGLVFGRGLKLKPRLMPYDLASVVDHKLLKSTLQFQKFL